MEEKLARMILAAMRRRDRRYYRITDHGDASREKELFRQAFITLDGLHYQWYRLTGDHWNDPAYE